MAKTDLIKTDIPEVSEKDLLAYLDNIQGTALNDNEKIQFLSTAKAYGLNPFKREIYCNVYVKKAYGNAPEKRTLSIIVGYEVYLKRAERTGLLDGWDTEFTYDTNGEVYSCITTIYRKDRKFPFKWEVFFDEQAQYTTDFNTKERKLTAFWEKKKQQLRKVGISQTFRICFPDELGGMPYTSDEMPQHEVEDTTATVVQSVKVLGALNEKPAVSEDLEKKMYDGYFQLIDSCSNYTELGNTEDKINVETSLSSLNKIALLKHSIIRRSELINTVEDATVTARRLANMKAVIGDDNVTALIYDVMQAALEKGIGYENRKFFIMKVAEPEPELAEVKVNSSGIIKDELPI